MKKKIVFAFVFATVVFVMVFSLSLAVLKKVFYSPAPTTAAHLAQLHRELCEDLKAINESDAKIRSLYLAAKGVLGREDADPLTVIAAARNYNYALRSWLTKVEELNERLLRFDNALIDDSAISPEQRHFYYKWESGLISSLKKSVAERNREEDYLRFLLLQKLADKKERLLIASSTNVLGGVFLGDEKHSPNRKCFLPL